jgi:hypothetical protein
MSEIEMYDPEGKCKRCMGSGHIWKTVYLPDSMDGHMLIFHCPLCGGTGIKSVAERMLGEDALREQGLIK